MDHWVRNLFLLMALLVGSSAQPLLTQPASVRVSPGGTARISCSMKSGYNIGEYHVSWYQQRPGNPPRYLLTYYSEVDKYRGSGIPDRFSAYKDPVGNSCILTISSVLEEDDADYYCSVEYTIYYL